MDFEELERRVRQRVGSITPYVISRAPAGHPLTTTLCLLVNPDGTYSATRGDLRTITRLVRDEAGIPPIFANEEAACEWAWGLLDPELGKKPEYTEFQIEEARVSGISQRERYTRLVATSRRDTHPDIATDPVCEPRSIEDLPPTLPALVAHVEAALAAVSAPPEAAITTPGKFVERFFSSDDASHGPTSAKMDD